MHFKVECRFYQLIVISFIGMTLPFLILSWVNSQTEALNFTAKKIESADYYLLVFLASYSSPIIMKIAEIDFGLMLLTVGVIFVVAWVVSNIPSHPVLYLAKFRFYKLESESGMVYTLITRREIRNPKNITLVKQISNSMLME
ncbi:hypothetical protein MO867_22145 [Microbulbifer sp. OS29]|uniref:Uncharacterized protein n=1 Tax=Microbulbifer okhotskensis TaxID=2926617 RepID=A0A9X2ESI7_9GAMM|nr:hypothetical protein [Microbulbifer okhotskensis]MCO1337029.1 hypothetical protein [Microbulbifer okhotskensis]